MNYIQIHGLKMHDVSALVVTDIPKCKKKLVQYTIY